MEEDKDKCCSDHDHHHGWRGMRNGHFQESIYGLGFIGAAIYFIQHAATFWLGVLGFLKAIIWPVMVIYKLLELLKL
jgi:hypothetical protein